MCEHKMYSQTHNISSKYVVVDVPQTTTIQVIERSFTVNVLDLMNNLIWNYIWTDGLGNILLVLKCGLTNHSLGFIHKIVWKL